MSLTVADIQSLVSDRTRATSTAALSTYQDFLQEVLDEVFASHKWSWSYYRGDLTTVAPYTTGTAAAAKGATVLNLLESGDWLSIDNYATGEFYIEIGGKVRKIASIDLNDTLTLESALDIEVNGAYSIFTPTYELDVEINGPIHISSHPWGALRIIDPMLGEEETRFQSSDDPSWAISFLPPGPTSRGSRIRFWPAPSAARTYLYYGRRKAPNLTATTDDLVVPQEFKTLLVEGVLEKWYAEKDERFDKAQYHAGKFQRMLSLLIEADPAFDDELCGADGWDWGSGPVAGRLGGDYHWGVGS